jgi:hypothetical protein
MSMLLKRALLLFVIHKRKSGLFPTLYAPAEDLDVLKPLLPVFYRPTGGTRLLGSASVEDDLLVPGQCGGRLPELGIGRAAFKMHLFKLFLVIISADEDGRARRDSFPGFFRGNSFRFDHTLESLSNTPYSSMTSITRGYRAAIMSLIIMMSAKRRKPPPALASR